MFNLVWLTFTNCHFQDLAGSSLYVLYRAMKLHTEKGPVDCMTGDARYTLSEDKLLRDKVDAKLLVGVDVVTWGKWTYTQFSLQQQFKQAITIFLWIFILGAVYHLSYASDLGDSMKKCFHSLRYLSKLYIKPWNNRYKSVILTKLHFVCLQTLNVFYEGEVTQCRVLNCDTITQAKEKIIDQLYKNIPFSNRPWACDLDLGKLIGRRNVEVGVPFY